ncbi:MAG: lysine exporter LysO family protein [Bacteroidales bacterium]|nr:lysine exporter LysO family protein [Bacteroidales bacterium]
MFKVLALMILGIGVGYLFRKRNLSFISKLITVLIWILLFVLGLEVGSNPQIVSNLGKLGLDALVITVGALLGSIILAALLWRFVNKKKAQ